MPRAKRAPTEPLKTPEFAARAVLPDPQHPPHRRVAAALVAVVEALPEDQALMQLADLWRQTPDGSARRAIRAAAITILRRDRPAPPVPEMLQARVEPPTPEIPPPPAKTGAMTTLALEDAARMLFSAQGDDPAPPQVPDDAMATLMALDMPADAPLPPDGKDDPASQFRPLAPPVELDGIAELLGLQEPADPAPPKTKPRSRKPKAKPPAPEAEPVADGIATSPIASGGIDLDAAFAILSEVEDITPPKPRIALDLSAQFAAMEADDD